MAEKNIVFSSKVKYEGIFSFGDFYKFCYDYLMDELGFHVAEGKYAEKVIGDKKEIVVEWSGKAIVNDYFKYELKIVFTIFNLSNVEVEQGGRIIKTNKGEVEVKVIGVVMTDYKGHYETKPILRFIRDVYEKWVIPSRVEKIEDKLISGCDEFLGQAKSYLDLEGKK